MDERTMMCTGKFPEDDFDDFEVFKLKPNETYDQALLRAIKAYGDDREYYIVYG